MSQKIVLLLYIILPTFMSIGFAQSEVKVQDQKFDKKLQRLLKHDVNEVVPSDVNGESDIVFLDARELKEYETSHIDNAKWIGYKDFELNRVEKIPKDKKIVVYCSVGYRSEKIAEKLEKDGYTNVSNLYGGIFEWKNEGNSVQNKKGQTEDVHTFNKNWSKWLLEGNAVY